jgi:hypothetical protein
VGERQVCVRDPTCYLLCADVVRVRLLQMAKQETRSSDEMYRAGELCFEFQSFFFRVREPMCRMRGFLLALFSTCLFLAPSEA